MNDTIKCHACEKDIVLPEHGEYPCFAQISLERGPRTEVMSDGTPVRVRDRVAIACSPACWQTLLDDPSWKRRVRP